MDFSQQLAAKKEQFREVWRPEQIDTVQAATEVLKESGIEQQSLPVGTRMPNFVLPSINDEPVELNQLLTTGPVVVSFYRGSWCAFCSIALKALELALPAIAELGATLVSISPELPRRSRRLAAEQNLSHLLLYDRGNQLAQQFGITFALPEAVLQIYQEFDIALPRFNGDNSQKLPVPATFIVDRDGTIAFRFVDADYTQRLDPVEIVSVLKHLQRSAGERLAATP